jgi:hypothetical protein
MYLIKQEENGKAFTIVYDDHSTAKYSSCYPQEGTKDIICYEHTQSDATLMTVIIIAFAIGLFIVGFASGKYSN